jgi:hypothetical protein
MGGDTVNSKVGDDLVAELVEWYGQSGMPAGGDQIGSNPRAPFSRFADTRIRDDAFDGRRRGVSPAVGEARTSI